VLVPINKSRCHYQSLGIDGLLACDSALGNDNNSTIFNAYIGYRVVFRFRVHDPAAVDDQLVLVKFLHFVPPLMVVGTSSVVLVFINGIAKSLMQLLASQSLGGCPQVSG